MLFRSGGAITLQTTQNQLINNATVQANGTSHGGNIQMSTTQGDINLQSALIQTNGAAGRGGQIAIAATNYTSIESSTVEATGYTQGGTIKVGNDAQNLVLPFSILTNLDANSILNTSQTNLANTTNGGYIETSGQTINLLSSINAGRGGMWLLDPTSVTISTTSGTSTGTDPLLFTNQTNVSASQIQTAINSGVSVQIITDGTITQSSALAFNVTANGSTPSLTLDTRSGSIQSITTAAITDTSSGTGSGVTLNIYTAGGAVTLGATQLKGSLNVDNTFAVNGSTSGFITINNAGTYANSSASGIAIPSNLNISGSINLKSVTNASNIVASEIGRAHV